jgi:hypothetical protein
VNGVDVLAAATMKMGGFDNRRAQSRVQLALA